MTTSDPTADPTVDPVADPTGQAATESHRAGWLALGTVGAGLLNYVYALGLTHGLGASAYAVFAAGSALVLIEGVLGSAGVPWVLARAIGTGSNEGPRLSAAVNFAFWLNIWSGLVFAAVMGGIAFTFAPAGDAAIIAATAFTLSASSTGLGYLQGFGRTETLAAVAVAEVVVKVVSGFALVEVFHLGSAGALLGGLFGAIIPFVSLPSYVRHLGRPSLSSGRTGADGELSLWRSAAQISGMQGAVGVISTVDSILAAALSRTASGAAAYQAAATLGRVPLYMSTAIGTAMFPSLHRPDAARMYGKGLVAYGYLGIFTVIALVTVPKRLITFIFNDDFAKVAHWLPYAAALGLLIGLFNLLMTREQAQELTTRRIVARVALTLVYLALMVAGAQAFGIAGLALGACASLVILCAVLGLAPYQREGVGAALRDLFAPRIVLVFALVTVVLVLARSPLVWLPLAAVAGVVVLGSAFPELAPKRRVRTTARHAA